MCVPKGSVGKLKTELTAKELDMARRLHGAAIARGKAEAELGRLSDDVPTAFKISARVKVVQATIDWLRVYFEAVQHFKEQAQASTGE